MGCCRCRTDYYCTPSSLTDTSGKFRYPCDGMKRQIFMSSTVRPTINLTITNTGTCDITVELSQSASGTVTPKTYVVKAGQTQIIGETNITNIYVTASYLATNCCRRTCSNCGRRYYCASGSYSIA